jgi:hypothetical protein
MKRKNREMCPKEWKKKTPKTYNSRYSLVVTHLTTNPPVSCLMSAERTGSNILMILWSYVIVTAPELLMKSELLRHTSGYSYL